MRDFRYALVRYLPDPARMEPVNVGVILQGEGRIGYRLSREVPIRWRRFFFDEIRGEPVPGLQPPRDSEAFLRYLAHFDDGEYVVSRPLLLAVQADEPFEVILQSLYDRLVAPQPVRIPSGTHG